MSRRGHKVTSNHAHLRMPDAGLTSDSADPTESPPSTDSAHAVSRRSPRRVVYASAGVVFVGIGAVGVFVPGLPTVIWLMGASYLFARSSPHLEAKLIRNRFFGPYLIYLDQP